MGSMTMRSVPRSTALALAALLSLVSVAASAQDAAPPSDGRGSETRAIPPEAAPPAPAPGASFAVTLPDTLAGAVGTWDLAITGGPRRCVLTLSAESGPSGRVVRFPAGCRRALPILSGIAGWLYVQEGLRLIDGNARPILSFAREPDGRSLGATAGNGDRYSLVPLQIAAMRPAAESPAASPAAAAEPAVAPAPPADGPAPGLYALDRATQKDVCRVELSPPDGLAKDTVKDAPKDAPLRILPGCRDSGITVFDPVAWRYAAGLLTLKARRGHAVNLVPLGDGRWRRDPDIGVTLLLRKVEP